MPVTPRLAVLVLTLGIAAGVVGVVLVGGSPAAHRAPGPDAAGRPSGRIALAVLHDWDDRRAAAWASGDRAALSRLYVAGSTAGAADVTLLRRYAARGLVVQGMQMQVLRARVLTSRPRRIELEVADRLASAVVRPVAGSADARRLPADAATTHVLVLRRVGGEWLMARVDEATARR